MKITPKLCQPVLALLFVVAMGTSPAWAQKRADGKIILPPAPAPPLAQQPSIPLPFKPVADTLAPAGWTRYEVGEPAVFSLILPAEPGASAERMKVVGLTVTVRTYLSAVDSGVYGATYVEGLPTATQGDDMRQSFFEAFMTSFIDGFEQGVKSRGVITSVKRLEQRATTASGLSGYEQDFSYDKALGRVRLVFGDGRAYAVLAVWNGLSSNSERSTFFESLKVNTKR